MKFPNTSSLFEI